MPKLTPGQREERRRNRDERDAEIARRYAKYPYAVLEYNPNSYRGSWCGDPGLRVCLPGGNSCSLVVETSEKSDGEWKQLGKVSIDNIPALTQFIRALVMRCNYLIQEANENIHDFSLIELLKEVPGNSKTEGRVETAPEEAG